MRAFLALVVLTLAPGVAAQGVLFASPHTATCFLDVDGDGLRGLDEPVYLQQSCAGGVSLGDARLVAWSDYLGGTLVNGLHDDNGLATAAIATAYAYHDADGGGSYNLGDPLFLTLGPLPGTARPGDLPLTGDDAFTSLRGSDPRIGLPLAATVVAIGGESYAERDGNPGFTTGDVVYLDLDGSGQSSLGDLRLAVPVPADANSTTTSSTTSPASTAPSPSPSTQPTSQSSFTHPRSPSSSPSPDSRGVPLMGPVPAILILIFLAWRRCPHQSI